MYTESGPKIKRIAQALFILGCVASCVWGFFLAYTGVTTEGGGSLVLIGIVIAVIGSLLAWLLSMLVSGFGELVDDTHRSAQQQYTITKTQMTTNKLLEDILAELKKQNERKNAE